MDGPLVEGQVGALFAIVSDAMAMLEGDQLVAWNAPASALFGVGAEEATAPGARPLGPHLARLRTLPLDAAPVRVALPPHGTVEAVRRSVGGREVLLLRDVSATVRHEDGLRRLAALSRDLLGEPPAVQALLQTQCGEAKALTGGDYSALLLLRPGSLTETSHFVYDAPRHLFPERMPRVVGLLAVPLTTRQPARLAEMRGHPAGVGLPGVHPPMGPLLAVPLLAGNDVLGELAVANAPGGREFDEVDESLLVELAAQAAVAVAWAQGGQRERERDLERQEAVDTARHDIRTPLGAGKGFAKLLATRMERMTPAQVQIALDGLTDAFARIETFSARLLLDSRSEAPGLQPEWSVVPVAPLLEALRREAAVVAGDGALRCTEEATAPTALAGDPEMVRQVLDNLVGNALKHAGAAVVTVRCEGDQVRFDVRDEGPGIAEDEQSRLFDRWTRADTARAAGVPGLGLGLSIVKRLVIAHGGTVGVSSRPGEGATFWVTFPQARPDAVTS